MAIKDTVFVKDIEKVISENGGKLIESIKLFDVYQGKNLPAGKKSYAVTFILRDDEKTLADKQIDKVMQQLTNAFAKELGAELR